MKATMKPLNYTPHDIEVCLGSDRTVVYKTVGVCRAEAREACAFSWDVHNETEVHVGGWASPTHPLLVVMTKPTYNQVSWSPYEPSEGADVIVSVVAAPAVVAVRPDLRVFVPDTGPMSAIRYTRGTQRGQIKAIRRLLLWHDPYATTHLLRVIELVNPVNEGDGNYVLSRHLPTLDGIEEAVSENPAGGILELANEYGAARISAHIGLSHNVNLMWKWLLIQMRMEAFDDGDHEGRSEAGRELEDVFYPDGRTVNELVEAYSPGYVIREFGLSDGHYHSTGAMKPTKELDNFREWAKERRFLAAERAAGGEEFLAAARRARAVSRIARTGNA